MNYSINYTGFVDLAMAADLIKPTAICCSETENCKPAIAVQLYQGENLDKLISGAHFQNPIKPRLVEPA